jgi:Phage tail tube protein
MSQIAAALLPSLSRFVSMPEATYGVNPTAGTAAFRAFVPPLSIGPIDGMVDVNEVGDVRVNARDQTQIGQNLLAPTGSASFLMDIENIDWLLRCVFGNPVQTAGSGPTAGLTQNAYQSGGAIGSETVQYALGPVGQEEVRRCAGWSVDSFTMPLGKVDGVREIQCSTIAREVLRNPAAWVPAATPSARNAPLYTPGFVSSVLVNAVAVPIESGTFTYANNIIRRQETNGSRFTSDAVGGATACSGDFTIALRNAAGLNAYQGSTAPLPLTFLFQVPGEQRRLQITLPRAFVMVPDMEISDGPASVQLSFQGKSPTSGTVGMVSVELWHTT